MIATEIAIRRPVTTVMVYVALALIGLISLRLLPLEKFPDIEFPGIFIQIPFEASTPEEVERVITRPVEEALATLSSLKRMRSTSRENGAELFLEFGWDEEVSAKGIEARAKVDAIRGDLPGDVERIFIYTGSTGDQPIMNLRISADRDLSDAYDLLDRLVKRRVERVDGVSRVELYGVDPREIRILLNADRVAAHGVDLAQLRELLKKSNFSVSAGRITDGSQRLNVRPIGEFRSLDDVRDIIVDGADLRLRDVADVEMRMPDQVRGRHLDRKYAIGLDVYKQPGSNLVDVARRVTAEVNRAADHPQMAGIQLFELESAAEGVTSSLSDLLRAGAVGALLAFVVLYLFLRNMTTTMIVVLAVPFSLLITVGAMYFLGISMNVLSMMGLILAVGMLVDNGVVVTESIFRYRQQMPDEPVKATLAGVREVWLAVMAGTLTSIIVFVPILFGAKVDITVFLTHVAIAICVALAASLLIAQTLIPMLAARVATPAPQSAQSLVQRGTERYSRVVAWTLARRRNRWLTTGLMVLVVASAALPVSQLDFDMFPQEAGRKLLLQYHIEGKHPLSRTEGAVDIVEEYLYANKDEFDIRNVYSYYDEERAQSTLLLTPEDEARVPTSEVIERVMADLPEIIIGAPSFELDQQAGSEGFSVQITGESTQVLGELTEDIIRLLGTIEGLVDIRSDGRSSDVEVQVRVDRQRAALLGLDPESVAMNVSVALRGEKLRDFRGEDGEIDVRLAFRDSDRQSLEQLRDLPLYTPAGERVRLGAVADLDIVSGRRDIQRLDRATASVINANLQDRSKEDLQPEVEKLLDAYNFPPGYGWKFGRGFEQADETQQIMVQNILLGIALIFIVMAALFESTVYPLCIITSIAFSFIGVFWFFFLTGTTFSFMAMIGLMILIGVVVNNGIVLVDHINNLRREGMSRDAAVVQGGRDRLRPILMTVATTIVGLIPLAVSSTKVGGDSIGWPPYFPMARAIIGGLAFSTVTSLLLVPFLYVLLDDLQRWGRKVMATARAPRQTPSRA